MMGDEADRHLDEMFIPDPDGDREYERGFEAGKAEGKREGVLHGLRLALRHSKKAKTLIVGERLAQWWLEDYLTAAIKRRKGGQP